MQLTLHEMQERCPYSPQNLCFTCKEKSTNVSWLGVKGCVQGLVFSAFQLHKKCRWYKYTVSLPWKISDQSAPFFVKSWFLKTHGCKHSIFQAVSPWSLSVPDLPQYLRLRSGVWVCLSITAAINLVLLTESTKITQTDQPVICQSRQITSCSYDLRGGGKVSFNWRALTDPSVLVAVFVPLIPLIIKVGHSHRHFCRSVEGRRIPQRHFY